MTITDLGYGPDPEELLEEEEDTLDQEVEEFFEELDPDMAGFVDQLIQRIIMFCEELAGFEMFPYQRSVAYRIVESLILGTPRRSPACRPVSPASPRRSPPSCRGAWCCSPSWPSRSPSWSASSGA